MHMPWPIQRLFYPAATEKKNSADFIPSGNVELQQACVPVCGITDGTTRR